MSLRSAWKKANNHRKTSKKQQHRQGLFLEALEVRVLPSTVNWSNSASGLWNDAANWSTGMVPGSGDDVVVNSAAALTVTIQAGDIEAVNSLTTGGNDTLVLSGGSLAVSANSTLNGALSITDATLIVSGSASFTANGATTAISPTLDAEAGAVLNLPELTTFSTDTNGASFVADGQGSAVLLSNLTNLGTLQSGWSVQSAGGGNINLSGLATIDTPLVPVQFLCSGSGSQIDLSMLTSLHGLNSVLVVTDSGTVLAGGLTTMNGVQVTLDGTGAIATGQWTALVDGSLSVTGGSYTMPALSDVDGSALFAQGGGSLALPAVTHYAISDGDPFFQSAGVGSMLDLSSLASLGTVNGDWDVHAIVGGQITLSALTDIDFSQLVRLEADGIGSRLDLSSLREIHSAIRSSLSATNGGSIAANQLTSLSGVSVAADGSGAISVNQWTALTDSALAVNGGAYVLSELADADSSSLIAIGGGNLSAPVLASYAIANTNLNPVFEATDPGSSLNLPALATLGTFQAGLQVEALQGAQILFPALTGITSASSSMTVHTDGSGSQIQFPVLAGFSGVGSGITVGNTAVIDLGGLMIHGLGSGNAATINVPQLPSWLQVPLALAGGTYTGGTTFHVPSATSVSISGGSFVGGVTFDVGQGGTVDLTGGQAVTYSGTLTGSGSGSVQLSSGSLTIGLGGLTLNFSGTMFQWIGGQIDFASGNLTNVGTMTLAGDDIKQILGSGLFDDVGTLVQTGTGDFAIHNSDPVLALTLKIEPAGLYLLESDARLIPEGTPLTAIDNEGTIRKVGGTGISSLILDNGPIHNGGTIEADSGTLDLEPSSIDEISGTTLTGGAWDALNGATLQFPIGTNITNSTGTLALGGTGAAITGISGLASNSGTLSVGAGADFTTAGNFTNNGNVTLGGQFSVAGNYIQTSSGVLNVQIGAAPVSGQFGRLVATGVATLAGGLNVALVNGFAPTGGQDFKILTFASATGTFETLSGLNPFFTTALHPTSFDLVSNSTGDFDLVATRLTAPTTAISGQAIPISWQASNPGAQAITGTWQDSVYLSNTPTITPSSVLLGAAPHAGGLGAGDTYTGSLTAALPALAPGFYYILVQVDSLYEIADANRTNNILAATTGQLDVSVPSLLLGQPLSDAFTAANEEHYYQIAVPAGGSLQVTLASAASSGIVQVCIGQGTLPTSYQFQERGSSLGLPTVTVTVPQVLTAGTYYILAQSISGAAATAGYTISAVQTNALTVSGFTPSTIGNSNKVTLEIDGTNFSQSTTARLFQAGNRITTIPATQITFINPGKLFATFDMGAGLNFGDFLLQLQDGAQTVPAPSQVHVTVATSQSGTALPLSVQLNVPQFIRSGRTGTVAISYQNPNNFDMVGPLLSIQATNPTFTFSTPDDPNNFTNLTQVLAVASDGPAGILRPGQGGQITLTILSNDTVASDVAPIQVGQMTTGQTIDWASEQASLRPDTIPAAAWSVIFKNLTANLGATTDSYNAALAQAASYLGGLGESTAQVSNVSRLWSFLLAQANAAFPTMTLASGIDASLPVPGALTLAVNRVFQSTISARNSPGIFGLGWASSWQTGLTADSTGNVSIHTGGAVGFFVRQADGSYLNTDGEHGALTNSAGTYTFTTTSGTQYVFLQSGSLNYVQDTNGNRITLAYDNQNRLVSLTYTSAVNPSEPAEQLVLTYNALSLVSQAADGTGNTWTYLYDQAGHLLSETGPGNLVTTYTYDSGNNPETTNALLSVTNPDGAQENFTYDSVTGRLAGTSQNGGVNPIIYGYGREAQVTATDAGSYKSTLWYNDLGQPARFEDAQGGIWANLYDPSGNLVGFSDAAGNTYQYAYDRTGNLTQIVNPLGQTVQMTYGSLSNLTSLTDGAGNTTRYNYDAGGNLLGIDYPGHSQQSFQYDPLGNLSQTVLQNGHAVGYQYNAQGLVTAATFTDGSSQTFSYDAHGNLLTAKTLDAVGTNTGTTTLTYNAANELLSVTYPNGQRLNFTYNPATGQRTQSVDQGGFSVNYSYDAQGRLAKLTDGSGNRIVEYAYNNLGQLVQKQNGNGTETSYAYDATGNLSSLVNLAADGKTVNSSFSYTYNLVGEVASETDEAQNVTTYSYDANGQLTQIDLPGGRRITYVYDAVGNRSEVINNGTATAYVSSADNEITQVGSTTYTYDANGNLHTVTGPDGTTTYAFNDLNHLVSIAAPDGTLTNFQYSPLGFLVGTSTVAGTNTSQTNYLVDPAGLGNVVAASDGGGALIAHYTYGIGLVNQTGPSGTGFYDFGLTGNTIGITNAQGDYVNHYSYLPFGETTPQADVLPNPFTFAGQFGVTSAGNGLLHMGLRNYDVTTGQFTSNDPLGVASGDSNFRRYVDNQPSNFLDPSGLVKTTVPFDFSISGFLNGLQNQLARNGTEFTGKFPFLGNDEVRSRLEQKIVSAAELQADSPLWSRLRLAGAGLPSLATRAKLAKFLPAAKLLGRVAGPLAGILTAIEAAPPAIGLWQHPPTFHPENLGRFLQALVDNLLSLDPNALLGPAGFGTQRFIQPGGAWSYTVDFENDGSVAAQDVTVTEQLDPDLDWSTFQLGSFGFGSVRISIPGGLTQYRTTVSYQNTDGSSLNVNVALSFNVQTGVLTVAYASTDPLTGVAPTGVFDGFLPPDNSRGVGEGFVQYTIRPKAGLTTGATITQQAAVVFDTNAPLNTAPAINTIDSGAPTSSVNALPAESPASFTVNWAGQDDAGGSGVAFFDVFVSDNGGAFTPFVTGTTQTSATFTGQVGHTYGFCSVATDNVGNQQAPPTGAQAITSIMASAQPGEISGTVFQDININGVQEAGEPGLAEQTLFLDLNGTGTLQSGDPTATTDARGAYQFTGLSAGTYTVRQVLLGGVLPDAPASDGLQVRVTSGATVAGPDFADVPTSIAVPLTLPVTTPFPKQGNANADFVEAVYRAVFNRDAEPAGLAFWTNLLNSGTASRLQVVQGIRTSPEHFGQEVTDFYFTLLSRAPDASGLQFWVQALQAGLPEEQLAFDFLNSPEYLSKGDKFFIDHMYLSLLGRGFDSSGEAFWLNQLGDDASGNPTHQATLTHEQLITDFLRSPESLNRLVEGYYQIFLRRLADPQGLSFWLSGLQQGQSFLTIGQDFLTSNEFYNNAAAQG